MSLNVPMALLISAQAATRTHSDTVARTRYAARGRLIPLSANSPTGSTCTAPSTFTNTRGLMRI
jgi:hypothetical protein